MNQYREIEFDRLLEFDDNPSLKIVKDDDLKILREIILKEQNYKDAITGLDLSYEDSVVDHKHRRKSSDPVGVNGDGLIRGVIDYRVNSFEGKIVNSYYYYGINKLGISLPDILRKIADYLERAPTNIIHPTEKPKPVKIGKRLFNKLNKLYQQKYPRRKPLVYPSSGKLTKPLKALLEEFNLIDELKK